ncbi:hypothetical protein B484DRAFT_456740 [Ochromonadaceae sp. CCMP2298]|nr:hypothetical protein B484DRAFT_456740 [Ochromonadaceae sp. CCMP2298]
MRRFLCLLALVLCVSGLKVPLLRAYSRKLTASLAGALIAANMGAVDANALVDDAAMAKFEGSLNELTQLDEKWDTIVKGEGDNVRRKLGTVYAPPACLNPMCGISTYIPKFAKTHPDDINMATFEEPASEFLEAYNQADFLAYSSVFSQYGNGGGGEDFIGGSRKQVQRAKAAMAEIIKSIKEGS